MAILPQMSVPTGHEDFTADEVLFGVNWLYGWDVTDLISFAGSTQVNRSRDDVGAFYAEFAQSLTVGYTLTEKLGGYTEWFAFFPSDADTARPEQYFDGGFTYKANPNLQFDIRAGVGLNRAADNFFTGAGAVIRF